MSTHHCVGGKLSPPGVRLEMSRKSQLATFLKAAKLQNLGKLDVCDKQPSCSGSCVLTKRNFPNRGVLLQTSILICSTRRASVYIAPGSSPRQAARAAQLHQESQREQTARWGARTFQRFSSLRTLFPHQLSGAAFPFSVPLPNLLSGQLEFTRCESVQGRDFTTCDFCVS